MRFIIFVMFFYYIIDKYEYIYYNDNVIFFYDKYYERFNYEAFIEKTHYNSNYCSGYRNGDDRIFCMSA